MMRLKRPGSALACPEMSELAVAPRQRSLRPLGHGALEGWMDEDAAAAAGQLFGSGPAGLLVVDARELLASTARVVGATLGELHLKAWMAIVSLHVASGLPEDGRVDTTIGELAQLVWGPEKQFGGLNTSRLLRVLHDLREVRLTVPGFDLINQRPAAGVSDTGLMINLYVDKTLLQTFHNEGLQRAEIGRRLGGKGRGTIGWRMHPDYAQHLGGAELRRFNWAKAQQLRGVALALWMVFASPRVPYRPVFEATGDLETVEILLLEEHCHALGVRASTDAARRRTFNDAGQRVVAADSSFVSFEAHGGRGRDSFLRVVRHHPRQSPLERPLECEGQLVLDAAA